MGKLRPRKGREIRVRLIKCAVVAGVALSTSQVLPSQAFADDDTTTEIKLLKAKLKELEKRVDDQGRKEKQLQAQTRAIANAPAIANTPATYKAPPSVFDPCPDGKVCYKGVTLTFGGWVDLTGIYRTRNLASDTGSVYNFIPFAQSKNFDTPESRFSARQSRFSVLAEGNVGADTHVAGFSALDFEGAAQT